MHSGRYVQLYIATLRTVGFPDNRHSTFKVRGWLDAGGNRVAIPAISQGLSARNPRLTAAVRARNTVGGAVEFPVLRYALLHTPDELDQKLKLVGRGRAPPGGAALPF